MAKTPYAIAPDAPTRAALAAALSTNSLRKLAHFTGLHRQTLRRVRDGEKVAEASLSHLREKLGIYEGGK